MNNLSNDTSNFTFNCLNFTSLSDVDVTDVDHWRIQPGLEVASSVLAAIYIIFFLIASIWNLFIVITYLVKYKLLKEPGNIFLFNLALADLLVALTVMMFSFVAQAAKEFVFGETDSVRCDMCSIAGFCVMFFIFMSLHLLAALSIDRFILLSRPLRYKQMMSAWKAIVIVISIWIISFIIAILPVVGFGQHEFNRRYGGCLPRFTGINPISGLSNFYYVIFCVVEALIPIGILALTNVFTYRLVSKFLKRNFRRRQTFRSRDELKANNEEGRKHQQQQQQLVKVFGALFIANIISWTPVILVVFAVAASGQSASSVPDAVYIIGWVCYLTNPVFHPIIESFFVRDLRYQVKRAQRTVRRASTAIIRSVTQQKFGDSDLDRANAAVDSGAPPTERKIKFFSKNKQKYTKKNNLNESTMATEEVDMDEMLSSCSPTPEPTRREVVGMAKVGRSVTFTETSCTPPLSGNRSSDGLPKSSLKRHSDVVQPMNRDLQLRDVITEENEEDVFEDDTQVVESVNNFLDSAIETIGVENGERLAQSNGTDLSSDNKPDEGEVGTYV